MSQQPRLQNGERAFNWLLLIFSLGIFYEAYRISGFSSISSPGAFPIGLSLILIATMITIIAGQFRKQKPLSDGPLDEARQFLQEHLPCNSIIFIALTITYLLLLKPLGFIISTLLFLFVSMVYFRRGQLVMSALISAGSMLVIYSLFKLLFQVYLP